MNWTLLLFAVALHLGNAELNPEALPPDRKSSHQHSPTATGDVSKLESVSFYAGRHHLYTCSPIGLHTYERLTC